MFSSNHKELFKIVFRSLLPISTVAVLVAGTLMMGCNGESKSNRASKDPAKANAESTANPTAKNTTSGSKTTVANPSPGQQAPAQSGSATQTRQFTEEQLHKNANLLLLAMEPDIRARQLIQYLRAYLTDEQEAAAVKLILEHDETFQDIIRRRAAILENAKDGEGVPQRLRKIKEETIIFSEKMRIMVQREIMTEEQRQERLSDRNQAAEINNR